MTPDRSESNGIEIKITIPRDLERSDIATLLKRVVGLAKSIIDKIGRGEPV